MVQSKDDRWREQADRPEPLPAWSTNSNDALFLTLRAAAEGGARDLATFHPKFTYSVFGDEELIFGYENLKVQLRFRANDMRPNLQILCTDSCPPEDGELTDIEGSLHNEGHLPKVAFARPKEFETAIQELADDWTPPGTLVKSVKMADGDYEIWHGEMSCPAVKSMTNNVQFLVPLFIEGGSYITSYEEDDWEDIDMRDADRWTGWFLFQRQQSTFAPEKTAYTFIGMAMVYRFFFFESPKDAAQDGEREQLDLPTDIINVRDLPCRTRLSQFLILPPFQGKGKGAVFYNTIFEHYSNERQTREFTVENPNESFDDLRDCCDLAFLRGMPDFQALRLNPDVEIPQQGLVPPLVIGQQGLEDIRRRSKIAPRQFARLVEMHLMSQLPGSVRPTMELDDDRPDPTEGDKKLERIWCLFAKRRLYVHNRDVLAQISLSERKQKLQETLGGVALEYARLLAAADRAAGHNVQPLLENVEKTTNGKRRLEDEMHVDPTTGKRTRVEMT